MFDNARSLADAVKTFKKAYHCKDRLWASWGDYDRRQFERVCKAHRVGYPFGTSHLNIKSLFAAAISANEVGLDGACRYLGQEMEGIYHRGDDDAGNIADILCGLLNRMRTATDS